LATIRLLLISGSTRNGSSNTLALRTLHELDHPGLITELYDGLPTLPAFIPYADPVPAAVEELLTRVSEADAVVFSTPEYAGGLPGALKNLLDWTVGGGQLYEKPVAWLDVANPGRGAGARAQLQTVLGYVGARVVDSACTQLALDRADGAVTLSVDAEHQLCAAVGHLASAVEEVKDESRLHR
jgi:chromate reductase